MASEQRRGLEGMEPIDTTTWRVTVHRNTLLRQKWHVSIAGANGERIAHTEQYVNEGHAIAIAQVFAEAFGTGFVTFDYRVFD
jgi:hypothetical protein